MTRKNLLLLLPLTASIIFPWRAPAKERPLKESIYQKYFWGARQAFERRQFEKAARLFETYRRLGSPADRLVEQSGCTSGDEAAEFGALLKATQLCIRSKREKDATWNNFETAKREISQSFENGDAVPLLMYVGCAPVDLTAEKNFCPSATYTSPPALKRLVGYVHERPDIYRRFIWRDRRVAPEDEVAARWVLTTTSERWKPLGLPNAFLMTLRQDKTGRIRIAAFAATLEP